MKPVIIVEGKNDKSKLENLLREGTVDIYCTFGTPGEERIAALKRHAAERDVYIFTDNDGRGKKIRALLRETFPDAIHLHTNKGYAGVEGTTDEYLIERLEKTDLGEYLNVKS